MSHFAQVKDNIVQTVIKAEQDFINILPDAQDWIQCSYNTKGGKHYDPITLKEDSNPPLRKNYPGIGYIYDSQRDAFYAPQPFPSWILDEETCYWKPPIPPPEPRGRYAWNQDTQSWESITIPTT